MHARGVAPLVSAQGNFQGEEGRRGMLLCVSAPRSIRKVKRKTYCHVKTNGKGSDWCFGRRQNLLAAGR